jgi:hypothetical protein
MSQSATVTRSRAQLVEALRQQFELLKAACLAYDQGDSLQSRNIALRLRVLLHGSGATLALMKVLKHLRFPDTSTMSLPPNSHACIGMLRCVIEQGVGATWVPLLEGWPEGQPRNPDRPFNRWWSAISIPSSEGIGFSRCDLVTNMANRDGGAHVDLKLSASYDALTRDSLGFEIAFRGPGGQTDFMPVRGNVAEATIRQIGQEVQRALALNLPPILVGRGWPGRAV